MKLIEEGPEHTFIILPFSLYHDVCRPLDFFSTLSYTFFETIYDVAGSWGEPG